MEGQEENKTSGKKNRKTDRKTETSQPIILYPGKMSFKNEVQKIFSDKRNTPPPDFYYKKCYTKFFDLKENDSTWKQFTESNEEHQKWYTA